MKNKRLNPKTAIDIKLQRIQDEEEAICNFIGIDADTYKLAQIEEAYSYLEAFLPTQNLDVEMWLDALINSSQFWGWWSTNWREREKPILSDEFIQFCGVKERRVIWQELHRGKDLTIRLYGRLLEESYYEMVHQLIKKRKEL